MIFPSALGRTGCGNQTTGVETIPEQGGAIDFAFVFCAIQQGLAPRETAFLGSPRLPTSVGGPGLNFQCWCPVLVRRRPKSKSSKALSRSFRCTLPDSARLRRRTAFLGLPKGLFPERNVPRNRPSNCQDDFLWVTLRHHCSSAAAFILGMVLLLSTGEWSFASAAPDVAKVVDGGEFSIPDAEHDPMRSRRLRTAPPRNDGRFYHGNYHCGLATQRKWRTSQVPASRKSAAPIRPPRESLGERWAMNYGQILRGRDDMADKRAMFTKDAWLGMTRLQQYGELVESKEREEKLCPTCFRNRRLLEHVWQTVSNEYYDQHGSFSQEKWSGQLYESLSKAGGVLRSRAQTYTAIKEMVQSLGDPYSVFLSPDQYRIAIRRPVPSEIKYLAFQYTGVGIELGKTSPLGGLTVIAPFAGSPAEEAGILGGDRLLQVDNIPVDSLSADEAVALLRGPIGSMVELELGSHQQGNPAKRVVLERRALPLPPLIERIIEAGDGQELAYLRLHYFTHEGTKQMAAAIREGEALGVDGYVLDLRNNPGGVFEEAIAMAALWLDCRECDIAETVRTSDLDIEDLVYSVNHLPMEIFRLNPGTLTHAPLAIITNRSSASASEVFTGALRDNNRAITVGEKTFGKGVVQYFFPMDDGSGLKLTIAKYLTPSRYDITKDGGLAPDALCDDYPHERGVSDKCVEQAAAMLTSRPEGKLGVQQASPPLPYRWLPLSIRRLWTSETY